MTKFEIPVTFVIEADSAEGALVRFVAGAQYLDWSGPGVDVEWEIGNLPKQRLARRGGLTDWGDT